MTRTLNTPFTTSRVWSQPKLKMVLPEQLHHTDPTEEALLIDIVRERGGLTRYCQNAATQVTALLKTPSNGRKTYMAAKFAVRRLFFDGDDTGQLLATRTLVQIPPATPTCISMARTTRKALKFTWLVVLIILLPGKPSSRLRGKISIGMDNMSWFLMGRRLRIFFLHGISWIRMNIN